VPAGNLNNGAREQFSGQGPAVEGSLGSSCRLGQQREEELVRFVALTAGGFKEAAQHAVVLQTLTGAGTLNDFSHDDQRTQAAFGLIVSVRRSRGRS